MPHCMQEEETMLRHNIGPNHQTDFVMQESSSSPMSSSYSSSNCSMSLYCEERSLSDQEQDSAEDSPATASRANQLQYSSTANDAKQTKHKAKLQYIPSYIDPSKGPTPCLVCGDEATGYHYSCMTCEGCKGFFRRSIQRGKTYKCKADRRCNFDKDTRNKCQACRFQKCLDAKMNTNYVLDEVKRMAKRRLVEENRRKRKMQLTLFEPLPSLSSSPQSGSSEENLLGESERILLGAVVTVFQSSILQFKTDANTAAVESLELSGRIVKSILRSLLQFACAAIIPFSRGIPGFEQFSRSDKIALCCYDCCVELFCLRLFCAYNTDNHSIVLPDGLVVSEEMCTRSAGTHASALFVPVFRIFAELGKFDLNLVETAMLASLVLAHSERASLEDCSSVDQLETSLLSTFQHYVCINRPNQPPTYWTKLLMKLTDLRLLAKDLIQLIYEVQDIYMIELLDEMASPGGQHADVETGLLSQRSVMAAEQMEDITC